MILILDVLTYLLVRNPLRASRSRIPSPWFDKMSKARESAPLSLLYRRKYLLFADAGLMCPPKFEKSIEAHNIIKEKKNLL